MSVNLRRFVNLNISRTKRNIVNPVRDTVALYGATAKFTTGIVTNTVFTSGALQYDTSGTETGYKLEGYDFATGEAISPIIIAASAFTTDVFYAYAKTFFDNGGAKLHVYIGTPVVDEGKIKVGDLIIPDEEIAIAGIQEVYGDASSGIYKLAHAYNIAPNPYTASPAADATLNMTSSAAKIFVVSSLSSASPALLEENIGVKFGNPGVEMTILAYLSRINPYGENTVHDYAFTTEIVDDDNVFDSDADVGACMQNFINIDSMLAKAIRNVGGDLITGQDLVNYYVTIVLQQTVEEAVMNVLSDKLSGAEGTAVIYNTVVGELNKYVRCGLLTAGNWESVDWIVEYNGENYVVVNANERVTLGYKLLVVPFAAMTQEDVASHACPPIYVALTNAYGIRKVTINGEVR